MRKRGVILSLLVISIVLINAICGVGFASADLLEDMWSKITGEVIEENIIAEPGNAATETKPEVTATESKPVEETCPSIPTGMWCFDGKILCPQTKDENGCLAWDCGACGLKPEEDKVICCAITPILEEPMPTRYEFRLESECNPALIKVNYAKVSEDYCEKKEELVAESEFRESEEVEKPIQEPEVCAVKIKISSSQKVYYTGDNAEIWVEIFDEQGNLLPNYPFYGQVYDGKKWQAPSKDRTGKDGTYRRLEIIKEGDINSGKSSVRVFTKTAGCNSVEDILELEVRKAEKEEVCGIGVCVPEEPRETLPVEIPEEKILYSCSGCKLESRCYPLGYRKIGGYCSENYEFVSQKEEGACENNFECKSNVCVSGECIGESLIKKIIEWFKGFFGKEKPEEPELTEPKAEMCSDWLIEKNIGDYKYSKSAYGLAKESQVPLYSGGGEQIGIVRCCVAGYLESDGESKGTSALVCPYDSRADIENSLKWLSARGELTLGEYKGQKVYNVGNAIIWTHKEFILVVGTDPKAAIPFSDEIADAYLNEYPNDLESIEISKGSVPYEPKFWVSCTKEDEKAVKECLNRPGSRLQTDPHPDKTCEVYVDCILSDKPIDYQDSTKDFLIKTGSLGEVKLIDFETLLDKTTLQNGDKLTGKEWESLGVLLETPSENYLKVFGPNYPFNPIDKLSLSPGLGPFEDGSETHDDLNIIFTEPVKAAGFYLLDLGETDERESITFLNENGNVLYKISPWPKSTFGNPAPGTFISFISEKGISKIEIKENARDSDDIAYDNLYFIK